METENNNQSGTKKGGTKVVIAISVVVILALVGVILWLIFSKNDEEGDKRDILVTEGNVEEVVEELQEPKNDPGSYTVKMNNTWHFKTGDAASDDAHVENIPENATDVYFDLFEDTDDAETNALYKSPIIPRGGTLEGFKLDKPLDAGTHNCIMVYHLVDDDQNTLSTLRVRVTLEVEG
jgi:hypothetical protein